MKKSLLMMTLVALTGCEAMLFSGVLAPALPVLVPIALIAENVDDPDRTTQPVRVEMTSGQVLATPADDVAIEATFTVTRRTITCKSTGETSRFGLSVTKMVNCSDGRAGTFSNGDPLSRYNPMRLYLGEDENLTVCFGSYEGNAEKGRATAFVIDCNPAGEAAVMANVTGDMPAHYTFWLNLP